MYIHNFESIKMAKFAFEMCLLMLYQISATLDQNTSHTIQRNFNHV